MITVFPERYPDELLYSQLARYCVWSGNRSYAESARDLFIHQHVRSDPEFVMGLNSEALRILTADMSFDELIQKTTMFNIYARFISSEKRRQAMTILEGDGRGIHKALGIGQIYDRNKKYLRFCPECAQNDRRKYGETYWHRCHQIKGTDVCPEHGCLLINSDVQMVSGASPTLISAEQSIGLIQTETVIKGTGIQMELAGYLKNMLEAPLRMDEGISAGPFLKSSLYGTKYASPRGGLIKNEILLKDISGFYGACSENRMSRQQLYDTLIGIRTHADEICRIAVFLGIPAEVILKSEVKTDMGPESFDKKVIEMRKQGVPYKKIAEELDASIELVKPIGSGRYRSYSQASGQLPKERTKTDWAKMDAEYYPAVKKIISDMIDSEKKRPERVCMGSIARHLGLRREKVSKMEKCTELIDENSESWEKYWSRKILWAVQQLRTKDQKITITGITKLTGIKKENVIRVMKADNIPDLSGTKNDSV